MQTVRAQQGDTVDQIAYRHYGDSTMVEAILDANPGLAKHGTHLPHGLHWPRRLPTSKHKGKTDGERHRVVRGDQDRAGTDCLCRCAIGASFSGSEIAV